jgi:soluble lytic murein transglycosylase-like protein
MLGSASWHNLAEVDRVFARSRRRAAAKRALPRRRRPVSWRTVWSVVLALALLGFIAETTRVEMAPGRATGPKSATATASSCGIPTAFVDAFRDASRETGLSMPLLVAVAWEESRMNPSARSHRGAYGLLQLMPETARAVASSEDSPRANIMAGARYLSLMLGRFDGDVDLALAAYNAGPTAVQKAGAAPTIGTLRYAKNVEARASTLTGCA